MTHPNDAFGLPVTSSTVVALSGALLTAATRFGSPLREMGYGPDVKADNSTDGITCESLLRDLRAVQARGDEVLGPTEKTLLVILERITGDEFDKG